MKSIPGGPFINRCSSLTILIPAHNEEDLVSDCIKSLIEMNIPSEICNVDIVVVDDRSEDGTKDIAEAAGARVMRKNFRGDYASAISETVAFGVENTEGDLILKCDADIQNIPKNALEILYLNLKDDVKRVSSEVITKTKQNNLFLDFLFFLRHINYKISYNKQPRGAFTLFERSTVNAIGGFDKTKPTWDTAFDQSIRARGWKVKLIGDLIVTEKRNFTVKRLVDHQISSGRSRRRLGIGFLRTLSHSIFRLRLFVLWGYLDEVWNERRK